MIAIDPDCTCGSIGRPETDVRLCTAGDHHVYWRGDQRLTSVGHIIRAVWPHKPNFTAAKPSVLANALNRGVVVDRLISKFLAGELKAIPAGTRVDAVRLFFRLRRWWSEHAHAADVRSQVILCDNEVAGCCDILD